ISELANTAWSLLEEYDTEYKNGNFTIEEAQNKQLRELSECAMGVRVKIISGSLTYIPT
ncbi:MAG: hypothetical protein HC831_29220, partial [Chloroflexia bacterium]|nr:hypothetical protein [Chloroflexia bacterium]